MSIKFFFIGSIFIFEVVIAEGADSFEGYFLEVSMMEEDNVIATGYPFMNITLPLAESVDVWSQCNQNKLTRAGDLASSVFGIRTSCQLYIRLRFPNDVTKFMQADSRTLFDYPEDHVAISESGAVTAILGSHRVGGIDIQISFPSYH